MHVTFTMRGYRRGRVAPDKMAEKIYLGKITIIPKPELRGFREDSLTTPPFGLTNRRERSRYNLPRYMGCTWGEISPPKNGEVMAPYL